MEGEAVRAEAMRRFGDNAHIDQVFDDILLV